MTTQTTQTTTEADITPKAFAHDLWARYAELEATLPEGSSFDTQLEAIEDEILSFEDIELGVLVELRTYAAALEAGKAHAAITAAMDRLASLAA